jgi:hypothetical protein
MKKSIVLFSIILFCLSGIAKDLSASWVLTTEGKMNCKKINIGYNKARVVLENGQKKTIPVDLINSYTLNGKVFNKLPLYQVGKQTNKMVFMELIKTKSDLSLYKYEYFNYGRSAYDFKDLNAKLFSYFLYDNGRKLLMELDEKSLLNVCKLFGLPVRYK